MILLSALRSDTRVHLADSQCAGTPFWDESDLDVYIKDALYTLWGILPDDFLREYETEQAGVLASGTAEYDLPADYYVEYEVYYNGVPCRKPRYSERRIWEGNTYLEPTSAQPAYYIHAGKLGFLPSPTAAGAYYFSYLANPPAFVDGTTEVDLDEVLKPAISKLAAGRALTIKASIEEGKGLIESAMADLQVVVTKDSMEEKP